MADESELDDITIPPVWLDQVDRRILEYFIEHGPTYHINISKALDENIRDIRRRCKELSNKGILDQQDRTYYAITEAGKKLVNQRPQPAEDTQSTVGHTDLSEE